MAELDPDPAITVRLNLVADRRDAGNDLTATRTMGAS
jgi:hypothetical protein